MNRRRFIHLSIGAAGLAALRGSAVPPGLQRVEQKSWALGSAICLTAYHQDQVVAENALAAAFTALDAIEDVLSLYRPESELRRLNRQGHLDRPHPDLVAVLQAAVAWADRTEGAFDPTVQPLWPLYSSGRPPGDSELKAACRLIDWRQIEISAARIRIGPGQSITLNGIAQGFAADRVRDVLVAHGIRHALANTGEFGAVGRKPGGQPWHIGIQHPRHRDAYVSLAALDQDRFLATSGDYETTFNDDFSNNHIFDPATGRSPMAQASVTVLASSGLEADALSTAIFVLGPARGLELARSLKQVDAFLVLKNGDILTTPGFPTVA